MIARRVGMWGAAIVLWPALLAAALELEPNREYVGPEELSVAELGVSFRLPSGWVGALQGNYFIIGSYTEAGVIILGADRMSSEEALAFLSAEQDLGGGYALLPVGEPRREENTVSVDCRVTNGLQNLSGEVRAVLGEHGIGVAIVAVAPDAESIKRTATAIEKSVVFTPPRIPEPGEITGPWSEQLAGVKIVRFYHGSGYSEKEYYNFCPDGSFYRVFEAGGVTPNVASGAFLDENGGRWSVSGPLGGGRVRLYYRNGATGELQVALGSDGLMVNGVRWLRDTATCQ